ncbi:unnamed protein product [Laminaria digitata]
MIPYRFLERKRCFVGYHVSSGVFTANNVSPSASRVARCCSLTSENVKTTKGLMEKVLSLSLEESNFTTAPPAAGATPETAEEEGAHGKEDGDDVRYSAGTLRGAGFQLERHINVAVKMLSLDPNLAKIHARLIAHIPEKKFWHHYFSRVAALRTEVGLEPLCEDLLQDASGTSTSEEYDKVTHEDVQSMNSPSDRPAEKGHDLDSAEDDDDFSDLGELDDLDGDSDGSDDSIDAALEAEIAAELGEG